MAEFDEIDVIRASELRADPVMADLKMLGGDYTRLSHMTTDLSEKVMSMEAKIDVKFTEMTNTLSHLCSQLGIHPIDAEFTQHVPPVTNFSDPYVHDDVNRLSSDYRKNLSHKIEMPEFDGSNVYDWVLKVERFFSLRRYSELTKLDLVAFSLEGDVLKWFNWEVMRREFQSWEDFRHRLFSRFGAASEESPRNRLFAIKQTGTVSAYVTQFEELSAQVLGLDELHLEELFYKGLKPAMREVLRLKEAVGLENQKNAVLRMETSSSCHLFSDKYTKAWGSQKPFTPKPVTTSTQPRPLLLPNGEGQSTGQIVAASEEAPGNRRFAIKQSETVSTYVTEFEELSAPVIVQQTVHKEESITYLQVPISKLQEHSLQMHNDFPNVCENSQAVVGCAGLGTEVKMLSGLSQNRQVWEPGGVLADHVLEDNVEAGSKGLAYAGCVLLGMNCAGLGSGKEELLATGQQMQRTDLFSELTCSQNKKQMLGYKTRMFKYKSSLRITRSASRDMNQFVGFMKFQLKHKWRSKHLHTISALGFYLSSVFSTVPSATSGRLQGLLEQVLQKDDEAYPQILDKLQLNLKQGMDVHGASGLRLFLCQQKFSSIWHRWRRKDSDLEVQLKERALVQSSVSPELLDEAVWIPEVGCRELLVKWQDHDASENFWMFSKDFVQLYPSSKLEDKLVFEGGSIDTIKQSYYRKKKPWVETEGFSCKEALEGNGGFAVSLEV